MSSRKTFSFRKFPVRKTNKTVSKKLVGLFLVVILALVALAGRITYINVTSGADYTRIVLQNNQQQYGNSTTAYKRGDIRDRNGNLLATSERVYRLILDCSVVNYEVTNDSGEETQPYIEPTVNALVKFFDLDEDELYSILEADETRESQYQVLLTNVTIEEKEEFEEYETVSSDEAKELSDDEYNARYYINGVWFEDSYQRVYPQESLACDLIGFANSSNEASWGIEGYYSEVLNGTNGRTFGYYNSNSDVEQTTIDPVDGDNVISTCDINIQEIVRGAIEDFLTENIDETTGEPTVENVAVVVMDPDNGEILAMDSTDWYDLNDPRDLSAFYDETELVNMTEDEKLDALNGIWRNFCISDAYEPGSTFKPVTLAAALETGVISADETFVCDGSQVINGQMIRCNIYPSEHGTLTASGAIANSCNDVLMQIAAKTGVESFMKYQSLFNFGTKTGIDLPGESTGILHSLDAMGDIELATASFGQGFTCTMVQEAAAICALINGGSYYTPHVVKSITASDGSLIQNIEGTVQKQVVSDTVSDIIREAMGEVVTDGTGTAAKVEGYSMGGKTGTAQKIPRSAGEYLVSFIGFAPLDDPEVLVYVIVDESGNSKYPQQIAKQIFTELLPYMNIYPDETADTTDTTDTTDTAGEAGDEGTVEYGIDNDAATEPAVQEEDDTVLHGGNDLYSDGYDNDAF